jgi:DASH complex subunit DAD3
MSFDEDPASAASRDCAPSSPITTENPLLRASNPLVSDLEQEVLDEYTRLLGNVNKLSGKLAGLAGDPTSLTLDGLRLLERKTATVCTLLKASVYSIVLQQQMINESEEQQQQQHQQQQQQYEEGQDEQFQGQGVGYEGDISFTGRYA